LASGSIAFYYALNVLPRSGLLDEAVSILDQAVAQARRRGDILNVAFLLMWHGQHQTHRDDLRAAVADLREAIDLSVTHGMLLAWPYNLGFLALALLEQGDAEEAARVIDQGGFPEQLPLDQVHLVWLRLYRGRLRIEAGSAERGSRSCSRWARPFGWSRPARGSTRPSGPPHRARRLRPLSLDPPVRAG
jgi:hypothetical protein